MSQITRCDVFFLECLFSHAPNKVTSSEINEIFIKTTKRVLSGVKVGSVEF